MRILLVGMSHKSASVEIRERYAVDEVGPILSKLTDQDEIDEAVAISTCNRVEIIVSTRRVDAARHTLRQCFHADLGGGVGRRLHVQYGLRNLSHCHRTHQRCGGCSIKTEG